MSMGGMGGKKNSMSKREARQMQWLMEQRRIERERRKQKRKESNDERLSTNSPTYLAQHK